MRIVVTAPWGERLGGAEAMLQGVLDGARESGHEIELVFFQGGPWPTELAQAGFRVEVIEAGRLRQLDRWIVTVVRLARLLRRRKPDLILNWAAKTQLYGAPAAVLAGMRSRVVWWQHGIPSRTPLDVCATLLPARAIGCYCEAAAEAQAQLFPARETFVVAAGAPIPRTASETAPLDAERGALETPRGETPVVGLVGRLQPWKGQDRMLLAQVAARERSHNFHLVIVGGDSYGLSPEYAQSLPALVERLGLSDAVTLTGEVPDAGPYVEQMDILVNASDPEPFGIVLLEAMARGVSVVAVDSGGPSEFVEHGRTGMLASSGEPEALAAALEPLLVSTELRESVGRAGRERFLANFTDAAMRKRFFRSLEGLLLAPAARAQKAALVPGSESLAPSTGASRSQVLDRSVDRGSDALTPVTIVAQDVGSVGGMERQLAELAIGLRRLGHEVTVIAGTCELPADAGVVFRRVRGPGRPFLVAYPWFLIAGSIAVRRWRRGSFRRRVRTCSTASTALRCTAVTRSTPRSPVGRRGCFGGMALRSVCSSGSPSGFAFAQTDLPRLCACQMAWPPICERTIRRRPAGSSRFTTGSTRRRLRRGCVNRSLARCEPSWGYQRTGSWRCSSEGTGGTRACAGSSRPSLGLRPGICSSSDADTSDPTGIWPRRQAWARRFTG